MFLGRITNNDTSIYKSYNYNLFLSWNFDGEADGFLVYTQNNDKPIFETNDGLRHYLQLNDYKSGLKFTVKAFVNTVEGRVIIGESEKFVMQHKTYYEDPVAVAISGSFISNEQIEILKRYEVDEVIIALDKEFETEEEEKTYMEKVQYKFVNPLCKYFTVSILWDIENDLELKDAPTDKGKEIFEKIYRNRISV